MIVTTNLEQAKKLIKQATEKPIIVKAQDDVFNRKLLEYGKFDILASVEAGQRKDKLKNLDSGLNNVLANIAAKNQVAIGIDLKELAVLPKKEKALRLAKIRQNLRICRRSKTAVKLLHLNDKHIAASLLLTLGASSQQAKEAVQ